MRYVRFKGKEAMFRSKARWLEQGEKPTKYFFNLEKKNYDRKIVKELTIRMRTNKY